MILNSIKFLLVLYVVFFEFCDYRLEITFVSIPCFPFYYRISLWYSIINFFYLCIKDGLLHKVTCVLLIIFYKITNICFFIFNILTFIDKVSVFLLNCLCLGFYFPLFVFDIVLNNITKFYKILWNCFQRVYITFQRFLASTFRKYRCINTSCSFDL